MKQTELVEQAKLVRWTHLAAVRALMPQLRWLYHTPNGGQRSAMAGAQMTALGVKKGVPDLLLPFRMGPHIGLAIEMKSDTGSTTKEQKQWIEHLATQCWQTRVCRSAADGREAILDFFGLDHDAAPPLLA